MIFVIAIVVVFMMLSPQYATNKDIGLIMSDLNNSYFTKMANGVKAEAKKLGYQVRERQSHNSPNQEFKIIKQLVKQRYKVILINPIDANLSTKGIKYAQLHGVKIITLDSKVNNISVLSSVTSNDYKGGQLAAKYIIEKLDNKGTVGVIMGISSASTSIGRFNGFKNELEKSNLKLVGCEHGDFDERNGYNAAQKLLTKYPNIKAIFAENDLMALGAALAKGNKAIVIVGFDGSKDGIEAIKHGKISATIQQQPHKIGEKGAQLAIDYLKGNKVKDNLIIPVGIYEP
ncbi:MAG: sugar ABC transporter substrate-binding protein [Candidatus Lariskella arthropodorum]